MDSFLPPLFANEAAVSRASWFEYLYLSLVAKPQSDRQLYRLAKRRRVGRIFELGITDLARTTRLLRVAARYASGKTVKYAALDRFDARAGKIPKLSLIDAHRTLQATSSTVRLVPGNPTETLASTANAHMGTDLILVAPWFSDAELVTAWPWMPRMLHARSKVIRYLGTTAGDGEVQMLAKRDVARLAKSTGARLAA